MLSSKVYLMNNAWHFQVNYILLKSAYKLLDKAIRARNIGEYSGISREVWGPKLVQAECMIKHFFFYFAHKDASEQHEKAADFSKD